MTTTVTGTIDFSHPITWIIKTVNDLVFAGANAFITAFTTQIMPVVGAAFGLYVLLIAFQSLRGGLSDNIIDIALRFVSWAIVIGIGLNADTYIHTILPLLQDLPQTLAHIFPGSNFSNSSLDTLAKTYLDIIAKGFDHAAKSSWSDTAGAYIVVTLKAAIVVIGLTPFLIFGTVVLIIANVGIALVAMVGPLFFAFLLFPATRQYFSAWLNTALSYALIPLLVAIIAAVSLGLSEKMMLSSGGDLLKMNFLNVFFAAMGNLVLLFLLMQVSSIASSLSAGGINVDTANRHVGPNMKRAYNKAKTAGNIAKSGALRTGSLAKSGALKAWGKMRPNTIKPG